MSTQNITLIFPPLHHRPEVAALAGAALHPGSQAGPPPPAGHTCCHRHHSAQATGCTGSMGQTDSARWSRAWDAQSQPRLQPRRTKVSLQSHWKKEEMRSTSPKKKTPFVPPVSPAPFELFLPPAPETDTPNKKQTPQSTRKTIFENSL